MCFSLVQVYIVQRAVPQPARSTATQADLPQGGTRLGDGSSGRRHEAPRHNAKAQFSWDSTLSGNVTAGQLVRWSVWHTDSGHWQRQEPCSLQPWCSRSVQCPLTWPRQSPPMKPSNLYHQCFVLFEVKIKIFYKIFPNTYIFFFLNFYSVLFLVSLWQNQLLLN